MAAPRLGYLDYVKAAFHRRVPVAGLGAMPVNYMGLAAFAVLGLLNPGFWLLGAAAELTYLLGVSSNPRFQKLIDAERTAVERTGWEDRVHDEVEQLSEKSAQRYRRLLAELDGEESWQVVKVPISDASWSTWKRYCDVVGLSMGRAIAALIDSELSSVVDDEVESGSAVMAERERILDEREQSLARREQELDRHVQRSGRRPSRTDLQRLADQIEPPDPGWVSTASSATVLDPSANRSKTDLASSASVRPVPSTSLLLGVRQPSSSRS